jgi:hypothetical protein
MAVTVGRRVAVYLLVIDVWTPKLNDKLLAAA